jgi:hypothetical protein
MQGIKLIIETVVCFVEGCVNFPIVNSHPDSVKMGVLICSQRIN